MGLGKPQNRKTYTFPNLTEFALFNIDKYVIIVASLPILRYILAYTLA